MYSRGSEGRARAKTAEERPRHDQGPRRASFQAGGAETRERGVHDVSDRAEGSAGREGRPVRAISPKGSQWCAAHRVNEPERPPGSRRCARALQRDRRGGQRAGRQADAGTLAAAAHGKHCQRRGAATLTHARGRRPAVSYVPARPLSRESCSRGAAPSDHWHTRSRHLYAASSRHFDRSRPCAEPPRRPRTPWDPRRICNKVPWYMRLYNDS